MIKFIKNNINVFLLLASILVLNIIGSFIFTRIDLTQEKRYSLSKPTKEFLENVDDIVYVQVFLTGNLPSGMKELEKSVENTLSDFKAYAGSNFEYDFVDLSQMDQKTQEERGKDLMELGLMPIQLKVFESGEETQKVIFPGAVVSYKGRNLSINLLENKTGYDQFEILNNSIILLEYKFASAIQKLQQSHPPVAAFSIGHGEIAQDNLSEIIQELQVQQFAVSTIDLTLGYKIDKMVNVLIIAKPTKPFTEKEKYKIDQYLMHGGKVFWLLDQMAVDMDSLQGKEFFMANTRSLNLDDMLFKYGVRINDDLILDLQNTNLEIQTGIANNEPQMQSFNWPYFNLMIGNNEHAVSRNLAPIAGQFTSTIDTIQHTKAKKEILLTSSDFSKTQFAPARVFIGMVAEKPDAKLYNQQALPTAVALSGTFESVFKNRAFTGAYSQLSDTIDELKYMEVSDPKAKMIVVSDGDIIKNDIKNGKLMPLGYARYGNENKPLVFDNKPFLINCIEYLIDDNNLIETRSKVIKLRQLDATKVTNNKKMIQFNNLVIPVVLIALFGLAYAFWRRKKYAVQ